VEHGCALTTDLLTETWPTSSRKAKFYLLDRLAERRRTLGELARASSLHQTSQDELENIFQGNRDGAILDMDAPHAQWCLQESGIDVPPALWAVLPPTSPETQDLNLRGVYFFDAMDAELAQHAFGLGFRDFQRPHPLNHALPILEPSWYTSNMETPAWLWPYHAWLFKHGVQPDMVPPTDNEDDELYVRPTLAHHEANLIAKLMCHFQKDYVNELADPALRAVATTVFGEASRHLRDKCHCACSLSSAAGRGCSPVRRH